ncbi:MAG: OmpA family protein [Rhodobacterales bacterium]|nr:OmpA family protein [Rhodobacterales bacterium]MDX5498464.1 OmpA family protein [Rhodobacterales bacterium]
MARPGNAAPVIIKRKKVVAGGGHHGGAWKVAYADFVTAMMAFFLLMWLLNATTEKQRKGIADYFNPVVPVNRVSGGGDGAFGGESLFSEEVLAQSGTGASAMRPSDERQAMGLSGDNEAAAEERALKALDSALRAVGGESMTMERLMRHVVTRLTDEGLVVELFDLPDSPLFEGTTATPRPVLEDLLRVVVDSFAMVGNQVAVQGFVQSYPITLIENPAWELSAARAQASREILQRAGFTPERIQRVTGFADRKPSVADPMAERNNRLELVLLRNRR